MNGNIKVAVAMSGGIDSSVAAFLLLQKGYSISGATMRLCARSDEYGNDLNTVDSNDARDVCVRLGISHQVYDMSELFHSTVIKDFIETYYSGGTPNPCIICNKYLKFGALLDRARADGFDYIATGHYANVVNEGGRFLLKKATDTSKDQTYMLWTLSQQQLSHIILPLGDLTKPEIRKIGEAQGFVSAHKSDSQDICFVPDGDYASFLEKECGEKYPEGDYVDENGNVLGRHKGVIHYTVGQRKGLGISMGKHIFVTKKDAETNNVTLGDEDRLFTKTVILKKVNLIAFDKFDGTIRAKAKLRYRHKEADCSVKMSGEDEITLVFDEPQRAPAPGQSAVIYDGDYVIGGGIIQ